ncbi:MAG: peptidyl-prolyl cis-trans isomerase [Candidatus Hydrogenedentes bacterium]|nr:peptidyl-prolyl cis-trans isomerase [Candidatus Hydrogenedentota bacterium]
MGSEFDEIAEPKDNTKLIWAGLAAAFLVMAAIVWLWSRPPNAVSQIRFRHILITFKTGDDADRARALEMITQIRERLVKGESWNTLAKTYSNDPGTAERGGDMGWVIKGQMDAIIEAYVWDAPLRQLSDIIQSGRGFHVVEVTGLDLSKTDLYNKELRLREEEKIKQERSAPKKDSSAAAPSSPAPAAPAK